MYFSIVLSSSTCEVTSTNRFICLSQNNDMEIPVNEPNQASVSDITQSRHDDDNVITCTPVQTTMESYIDNSYQECTFLSLETDLDPSI